jgi:hypothetical protein
MHGRATSRSRRALLAALVLAASVLQVIPYAVAAPPVSEDAAPAYQIQPGHPEAPAELEESVPVLSWAQACACPQLVPPPPAR